MKSLLLTKHEEQTLRMFLLMTTNYRRGEQESCASLATETNDDGTLTFPKMVANAQWWQDCIDMIDAITEKMGISDRNQEDSEAMLYCVARHVAAYHKQCCNEEVADWGAPCSACNRLLNNKCDLSGKTVCDLAEFCNNHGVTMKLSI